MLAAADALDFEQAAAIRDRISQLRDSIGEKLTDLETSSRLATQGGKRRRGKKGRGKVPRPKRT